jgi:hypothetical protein
MLPRDFVCEDLKLEVDTPNEPRELIRLRWTGKANMRHPTEKLASFLQQVTEEAAGSSRMLEFDFQSLEHSNSSTILVIMQLVRSLRRRKVKLRILFNSELKWQRMTFDAIRQLHHNDELFELGDVSTKGELS